MPDVVWNPQNCGPLLTWIPEYPAERQYTCPGCKKGVKTFRVGNSCSYLVQDAADEKHEHDCKYKGPIDTKLLGYKPVKEKKHEPQQTAASGDPSTDSSGGQHPERDGEGGG